MEAGLFLYGGSGGEFYGSWGGDLGAQIPIEEIAEDDSDGQTQNNNELFVVH